MRFDHLQNSQVGSQSPRNLGPRVPAAMVLHSTHVTPSSLPFLSNDASTSISPSRSTTPNPTLFLALPHRLCLPPRLLLFLLPSPMTTSCWQRRRKFYTQETLLGEGHPTNSGLLCGPRNWHSWSCFPPRWRSQVLVSQPSLSPGNRIHLIFLRPHHSTQVCQFTVSTLPSSLLVVAPGSIRGPCGARL